MSELSIASLSSGVNSPKDMIAQAATVAGVARRGPAMAAGALSYSLDYSSDYSFPSLGLNGGKRGLGITENSRHPFSTSDSEAGQVGANLQVIDDRRDETYRLQGEARRLLYKHLPSRSEVDTPEQFVDSETGEIIVRSGRVRPVGREKRLERIASGLWKCNRVRRALEVELKRLGDHTYFDGLITCKYLCACPNCAAKITERRRIELNRAVERWFASGGGVVLNTYTVRHNRQMEYSEVLAGLQKAMNKFKSGKGYQTLKGRIQVKYTVVNKEVTHGGNGWHVHAHEIMFFSTQEEARLAVGILNNDGADRWANVCDRLGLVAGPGGRAAVQSYGFDSRYGNDSDIADYMAKMGYSPSGNWTASHELTKGSVKRGKWSNKDGSVSRTPFQLLDDSSRGDKQAGVFWLDYIAGSYGKHLLEWSRNAYEDAVLDLSHKTDEEIADEGEAGAWAASIVPAEWSVVVVHDAQSAVLGVGRDGSDAVHAYIRKLAALGLGADEDDLPQLWYLQLLRSWSPAKCKRVSEAVEQWAVAVLGVGEVHQVGRVLSDGDDDVMLPVPRDPELIWVEALAHLNELEVAAQGRTSSMCGKLEGG